jgi:thiol-disulfide isomerase/thioredoxin
MALTLAAVAQKEGTYRISGKIAGLADQKIYLGTTYMDKNIGDSVEVKNGEFSYTGKTPGMLMYGLRLSKNVYLTVPVDANEDINLTGSLASPKDILITGSAALPVWKHWGRAWSSITATAGKLYQALDSVAKIPNNMGDKKPIDSEFEKLNQRLIDSVEMFFELYPSSPVVPFIIFDRFVTYPNIEKATSTYAALTPLAKNSAYGKELAAALNVAAKTGIGVKPRFSLPDKNGKPLNLAAFKGKVVLVDFWASWCIPCRKENPNLVKAYAKYHGKGLEIIGVSLDDKKDSWLAAIKADGLTWNHVSDLKGWKSAIVTDYGIKAVPTSFLVDPDGKIIAKNLRGEELEKALAKLFK